MIKYKKAKTQENGPTGYLKKSNLQKETTEMKNIIPFCYGSSPTLI